MPCQPILTLTTDFGLSDHYVGAMKGVILGICPGAQIVDISHEVTPFEIAEGAYVDCAGVPLFPARRRCMWWWWTRRGNGAAARS